MLPNIPLYPAFPIPLCQDRPSYRYPILELSMSAILVFVSGIVLVALINLWRTQSPRYLSPLRHLRGPRAQSLLFGNFNQLSASYQALHREWINEYGPNIKVHGFFNVCRVYLPLNICPF